MDYDKPLPSPTPLSMPFWEGTRNRRLLLQRCNQCGSFRWTPQYLCTACHAEEYEWTEVSGRGTIYAYSNVHRPPLPSFKAPFIVAVVRLEEGPLMLTNIVDCESKDLSTGAAVKVHFEPATDEITLYKFRLANKD